MSIKIIQNICTGSNCYKAGGKIAVKGIMLHSVGCNQPKASVFIDQWNRNVTDVCAHGVIDPDGIYQTLPWNHFGWHAGSPANNLYIGIETTEPASIIYTGGASFKDSDPAATKAHIKAVYDKAVELFAYLCQTYKLDPLGKNVIISHNEGRLLGIATSHVDPDHLWAKYGYTMDGFRKAVKAKMAAPVAEKVLDEKGYIKGKKTIGVLTYKEWLIFAKEKGYIEQGVKEDECFGEGTEKATNELLKKWGYKQTGIAGANLIKRLKKEVAKLK